MEDADDMDETTIGPRRMSVHPLRLTTMNRRTTVLPPSFDASKSEQDESDAQICGSLDNFKRFQDAPLEQNPTTGAIRKSVHNKRRSSYAPVPKEEDPLKRKCVG